jgi:hypothetical protein
MKKFGTPIGAAPGSASVYVGFEVVGAPPFPRRPVLDFLWLVVGFELPVWCLFFFLFFFLLGVLAFVPFGPDVVDFFSEPPGVPVGGAWLEVVLVVVVDELELDEEELVVEVVVVVVPCEQTSVTEATGSVAGTIEEIWTPTGTWNVKPLTVFTWYTQVDADTAGVQAARPAMTLAARGTRS